MDTHKKIQKPFNLNAFIKENKNSLQPPIGNKLLYEDSEFIVMIVGENSRKDYHYVEADKLFYQLRGDMTIKIQEYGKVVEVPVREGEIFLLPSEVPHNTCRGRNTCGLVVERFRRPEEMDKLIWYCEKCNTQLYEQEFYMKNNETSMQSIFTNFYRSKDLRTCRECNTIMEPPQLL